MGTLNLFGQIIRQSGLYGKSLLLFIALAAGGFWLAQGPLNASSTPKLQSQVEQSANDSDINLTLTADGRLFSENSQLNAETTFSDKLFRLRYQVINKPDQFIESVKIVITLPKSISDDVIGHSFINNGGAEIAESQVLDSRTVIYQATNIGPETQLVLELELPRSYLTITALGALKERLNNLSPSVWTGLSISLPILTLLILLVTNSLRSRKPALGPVSESQQPPSRLSPAMLGILRNGRISNRELAATLLDLARRGHLIIKHGYKDDFRFSRRGSSDKLEQFELQLLDQIFGPSDKASDEEISFSLAQELFSQRVSQAFILAYQRVNDLGFFVTNPLRLHRRYQLAGLTLFALGLIGFIANITLVDGFQYLVLFWAGMMISALLITYVAKSIPIRTVFGDRELGRWLAFRNYLTSPEIISYQAQSQEKYLDYLPYAVVLDCEVEWTRRFYELPFTTPHWYVSGGVRTVDEFANSVFPLFGYLSQSLAISSSPSVR